MIYQNLSVNSLRIVRKIYKIFSDKNPLWYTYQNVSKRCRLKKEGFFKVLPKIYSFKNFFNITFTNKSFVVFLESADCKRCIFECWTEISMQWKYLFYSRKFYNEDLVQFQMYTSIIYVKVSWSKDTVNTVRVPRRKRALQYLWTAHN